MKNQLAERPYYPHLDGLRGLAILAVIICHNFSFLPFAEWGKTGVDLFFVLSGFLISEGLLFSGNQRHFRLKFFIRRAVRILPLFYFVLISSLLLTAWIPSLQNQRVYLEHNKIFLFLHLQNWFFIFTEIRNTQLIVNHFWSLAVEEQFYLIWPFILPALVRRKQAGMTILFTLSTLIIVRFIGCLQLRPGDFSYKLYYMTHIDGLLVGSLIAVWKNQPFPLLKKQFRRLVLFFLFFHALLFAGCKTALIPVAHMAVMGYATIALLFGAALTYIILQPERRWLTWLKNPSLQFVGKISYGLYLIHWPVFVILVPFFRRYFASFTSPLWSIVISGLLCFIIAFALSIVSYYSMESYFQSRRDLIYRTITISNKRRRIAGIFRLFLLK